MFIQKEKDLGALPVQELHPFEIMSALVHVFFFIENSRKSNIGVTSLLVDDKCCSSCNTYL